MRIFAVWLNVAGCCALALASGAVPVRAQQVPLTTYTTADGLSGNDVATAIEDAEGFLWLGTDQGLSRFDGKEFRSFGRDRGLPDDRITSLVLAGRDGLWVGTWTGVSYFSFRSGGVFSPVAVDGKRASWEGSRLVLDRHGQLWCGADGLYRLERAGAAPVLRRVPLPAHVSLPWVTTLAADPGGNLWMAHDRAYRRQPDGRFDEVLQTPGTMTGLSPDSRGRIWVTAADGFWVVEHCRPEAGSCRARRIVEANVVPWASPVWKPDGGAWAGTSTGMWELDGDGHVVRRLSRRQGLPAGKPTPLLLDRRGDLWIAIKFSGLQRLLVDGVASYGDQEGLEAGHVDTIFTTQANDLVVVGHPHVFQYLDRDRFTVVRPLMPAAVRGPGWGWHQIDLQDRFGHWWMATENGVVHWPPVRHPSALARTRPLEMLAWRGCFRGRDIFRLYEDTRGDIWIGTIEIDQPTLHRWNRATGTIDCFSSATFLGREAAPTAFFDDGRGTLWVGFYQGQVVRYRGGRFVCVVDCDNPSQGNITGLLLDRRQRLWVATSRIGVLRLDDVASDHPRVVGFTTSEGLASNRTRGVLEDRFGRIYVGSSLGVDVFDSNGARLRHYSVADGLPHPFVNVAWAGPDGDLWFGTLNGVARIRPGPVTAAPLAPRVLIDEVRVAGVPRTVAASGEVAIDGLVLEPDQRNLEVDFVALPRDAAAALRFQYRLSDADAWSRPFSNRSIVLAGLAAGAHRLEIRALDGGASQAQTAVVSFRVLEPVYRRAWFLAVAALVLLALPSIAFRARIAHATALERQRTRIAMDLHDEMGSRLGSIGLLADLAAAEAGAGTLLHAQLERIAETAAEMGSSLADMVWSLRRGGMTVEAVGRHLAVHGRRLFSGSQPRFETVFPDVWPAGEMSPVAGRAVLLIGLEALHNCARHAQPHLVTLALHPDGHHWTLLVQDDGRGLPPIGGPAPGAGFGLETMRSRAAEIGASLVIESRPARGTTVRLTFRARGSERPRHRMNIRSTWHRLQRYLS